MFSNSKTFVCIYIFYIYLSVAYLIEIQYVSFNLGTDDSVNRCRLVKYTYKIALIHTRIRSSDSYDSSLYTLWTGPFR